MGQDSGGLEAEDSRLRRSLRLWRWAAGVWFVLALLAAAWHLRRYALENWFELGWSEIDGEAPYAAEVRAVISPLRYSGIRGIYKKEVRLSFDYKAGKWTLHNIRTYDREGRIQLDEGKYGVCGELAAYAYQRLRPVFPNTFSMQVVEAEEKDYFPGASSQHYVVSVTEWAHPPRNYIIDPSFRRYGRARRFKNYNFRRASRPFHLADTPLPDSTFDVGHCIPLVIRRGHMVSMCVEGLDGVFDAAHHAITIGIVGKNELGAERFLVLQRGGGLLEGREDRGLFGEAEKVLGPGEMKRLKDRIMEFILQAEGAVP